MLAKYLILLVAIALVSGAPSFAQEVVADTPAQAQTETGGPPDESFFNAPSLNDQIQGLRERAQAPTSAIPGMQVGDPAPTYRTLADAAAAGINPSAVVPNTHLKVMTVDGQQPTVSAPIWPAILGGAVMMLVGMIIFGLVLNLRTAKKTT